MFTFNVRKLFRNTFGSWQTASPPLSKPRATFRPRLEALEERFCPATTDMWIATGTSAQSWDVGTNWSQGVSPNAGMTAVFYAGSSTPCSIPAGDNLPTIAGLTMDNYAGTLTIGSNLAANAVSIYARTVNQGKPEIIINSGINLYALQSLNWLGGNVGGYGNFEVAGAETINGTSSTDKPTLGARMDVGTTFNNDYTSGNLTFSATSQPLVVVQNASIYVNDNSTLVFNNQPLSGQTTATAISNGDTSAHSIIVNTGGTLTRNNVCELFVATGLDVEGGTVIVRNPQGQKSGNPLHFTRQVSSDGPGLVVNGGEVNVVGDLTADYGGSFGGGDVSVFSGDTLTLGVNANSGTSSETWGGAIGLAGKLVAHGGFAMYGGTFSTYGYNSSVVQMDTGNSFYLAGGELDITQGGVGNNRVAQGKLEIQGDFVGDGGTIVDTVDSKAGTNGVFQVDGAATLYTGTTFISFDLHPPPPNNTKNWNLMTVGGTRTGDFYYNLPLNWTPTWNGGTLTIQEKT